MTFYEISKDYKYKDVCYSQDTDWESIKCTKFDGHQRAGKRIGSLKLENPPKKTGDFLWTELLSELIITDKVADLLKDNKITGYKLKPVDVINSSLSYKLWEFTITGWAGIAPRKSGIKLKDSCKYCGSLKYKSFDKPELLVDEKQWDGSDVFMVWPLPRFIFVNEKVASLIKKEKLTGLKISPISELKIDSLIDTLSPGRLSMYMPDEKAKELGEPLGIY